MFGTTCVFRNYFEVINIRGRKWIGVVATEMAGRKWCYVNCSQPKKFSLSNVKLFGQVIVFFYQFFLLTTTSPTYWAHPVSQDSYSYRQTTARAIPRRRKCRGTLGSHTRGWWLTHSHRRHFITAIIVVMRWGYVSVDMWPMMGPLSVPRK